MGCEALRTAKKRLRKHSAKLVHQRIRNISHPCIGKSIKSPEENTLSSLHKMESQRILEILDSIFCSQRFSIEKFLVHFRISDKSVLQCSSSFFCFKHC